MIFDVGTIVLVPFPYSDLSASKRRPVLMLTGVNDRGDFIAMALTTKRRTTNSVALTKGPLARGGMLPRDSWICTDKIITLRQTVVIKALGRTDSQTRAACVHGLCDFLVDAE